MSKAALWAIRTVSSQNSWKAGRTTSIVRLAAHHVLGDAVNRYRFGLQRAFRIDHLVENLLAQQPVVDDAGGADLDDFVALRRLQAGRFGIEYGIGQVAQLAVEVDRFVFEIEQVEVVIFRPVAAARTLCDRRASGSIRRVPPAAQSGRRHDAPPFHADTRSPRHAGR
jgi:hypothetical protein